jgi:DNA segregation ATPase FtsK/SpoIIIE, S-DNA-T family
MIIPLHHRFANLVILLFLGVSLLSYSPEDPVFSTAGIDSFVQNNAGIVGAHFAAFLFAAFGFASWVLLPVMLFQDFQFFNTRLYQIRIAVASVLFIVVTSFFFESFVYSAHLPFGSGGVLGTLLKEISPHGLLECIGLFAFGLWLSTYVFPKSTTNLVSIIIDWISSIASASLEPHNFSNQNKITPYLELEWQLPSPETVDPTPASSASEIRTEPVRDSQEVPLETAIFLEQPDAEAEDSDSDYLSEQNIELPTDNLRKGSVMPLPPLDLLVQTEDFSDQDQEVLASMTKTIEQKLSDFKIRGQIIDVRNGPVVSTFCFEPAPGQRASQIINLTDDLARSISAVSVRVDGNMPGEAAIGIEVPNKVRSTVGLKDILESSAFHDLHSPLAVALGTDIYGQPVAADLAKMPHLLVAGTTGSGKSVAINAMICSILFNTRPDEVRFLMIDPKMLELSIYNGIPHLLAPVVTDVHKAANLLQWAVKEMEERYRLMSELGVRNLTGYNQRVEHCLENGEQVENNKAIPLEKKPHIVIVIDELADLMIQVGKEVEPAIARLAQMARAAGLHLVIATQRPSVDVITGLIKANFPTRLAFKVSSKIDSRTILDSIGADNLLGMGDGLYLPPGTSQQKRIHAPFVSDAEIDSLVKFLKSTSAPNYDPLILSQIESEKTMGNDSKNGGDNKLYDLVIAFSVRTQKISISRIQKKFKISFKRAAQIVEHMHKDGLLSDPDSKGQRSFQLALEKSLIN